MSVKDNDAAKIGRPFSSAAVEIALATYPGATMTAPPADATPYGVYQAAYLPNSLVEHRVVTEDGTVIEVEAEPRRDGDGPASPPAAARPARGLGTDLAGAARRRSSVRAAATRAATPTSGCGSARTRPTTGSRTSSTSSCFKWLLPETAELDGRRRFELPNLRALNFVVDGLLGEGVASSTRQDPQAKGLGEWLRSRHFEIPISLLED